MTDIALIRIAFVVAAPLLLGVEYLLPARYRTRGAIVRSALALVALGSVLLLAFIFINHIQFPLHLEVMEGVVLQHFERASQLEPVYPEPTPQYVPLAYNPLYYVISIPAGWLFGVNLLTLRLMSIIATIGAMGVLFVVTLRKTDSYWWALIVVGLFAAAYRVMDTYLDTAHSDAWFLFSVLLGSFIISRTHTRGWGILGVVILVAAFWFKQHGALFCVGGVLFLTWREMRDTSWREGLRRALPYWLVAGILGPGLYLVAGPALFGPRFHYFTWEVPSQWSELNIDTFYRYGMFIIRRYALLASAGGLLILWNILQARDKLDIWQVQFVFATLSGLMGALDRWSADNVFIPMGTWFILMGVLALYHLQEQVPYLKRVPVHLIVIFASFGLLVYDPRPVIMSRDAPEKYDELVQILNDLDADIVYAPWQSQFPEGITLYPAVHWVALEDMIRGPGRDTTNHPLSRQLLAPVLAPEGPAYILTNRPLDHFEWMAFLGDYYVLETDFGDRFEALGDPPKRFLNKYPRYLYRYAPEKAATSSQPGDQ